MDRKSVVSAAPQDPTEAAMKELIEASALSPGGHQALQRMGDRIKRYTNTVCEPYIVGVFFPECAQTAPKLPTKFDPPSTSFTNKSHFYISTDMIGRQALVFFPKAVGGGPNALMSWGTLTDQVQQGYVYTFEENYQDEAWGKPTMQLYDEIPTYYSNIRLIGASIRLTYIGVAQNVSGLIVGCINYGYQMGHENVTVVEDAQYVQHRFTGDGMRCIWLPRDQDDFKYMNMNNPATAIGDYSQAIMIYLSNLPPGSQRVRVDIVRHFQGIPNETIYPYVGISREPYNEKTMEIAASFHEKCPFLMTLSPSSVSSVFATFKGLFSVWDKLLDNIDNAGGQIVSKVTGRNLSLAEDPLSELAKDIDLL